MADRRPRTCPRCGTPYNEYPALSRWDNSTYVCPPCGTDEALIQFAARFTGDDPHLAVAPDNPLAGWVHQPAPH